MTLLFADGFEDGTIAWALTNAAVGTGRFGNGIVTSSSTGVMEIGITPTAGPLIVGFAYKPASTSVSGFFSLNSAPYIHAGLQRGASGEINVFKFTSGTNLGSSAPGVLPAGAWSYVEVKETIHDTTGSVIVRVNGVTVLTLTNIDTKENSPTTASSVKIGYTGGTGGTGVTGNAFDDVYICDSLGSYNNDFLGELVVEHLYPTSDDTAQWLGSDGNSTDNYALIDEAGVYSGSDYVQSSTIGHTDLYIPGASARAGTSPVLGVIINAVAMKTDAGTRTVKLDVKEGSGGSLRQGAEQGLPTSFGQLSQVFERKGDGSQFTITDVNALRMGVEVVT